jgi:hypothetical protein
MLAMLTVMGRRGRVSCTQASKSMSFGCSTIDTNRACWQKFLQRGRHEKLCAGTAV